MSPAGSTVSASFALETDGTPARGFHVAKLARLSWLGLPACSRRPTRRRSGRGRARQRGIDVDAVGPCQDQSTRSPVRCTSGATNVTCSSEAEANLGTVDRAVAGGPCERLESAVVQPVPCHVQTSRPVQRGAPRRRARAARRAQRHQRGDPCGTRLPRGRPGDRGDELRADTLDLGELAFACDSIGALADWIDNSCRSASVAGRLASDDDGDTRSGANG